MKMNELVQMRLKHFSKLINDNCEKIWIKLHSLSIGGMTVNEAVIITQCKNFLYDTLDQVVLPYSVFDFSIAKLKYPNLSFQQFFQETDWVSKYPNVQKHAEGQLELSTLNFLRSFDYLKHDWGCLKRQLDITEQDIVKFENLLITASDRHNGGQQTLLLLFSTGDKFIRLMYKPRSLEHLNVISDFFSGIIIPKVYKTDSDHGWQEFIYHSEPDDIAEYYRRAGKTLAVYAAINGTDAHFQNVVACSLGPVIVDWETVFTNTSYFRQEKVDTDLVSFTGLVRDSVEWWRFWQRDLLLNAGFYANGTHRHNMLGIHSVGDGTDEISVGYSQNIPYVFTNRPRQRFNNATECLIDGFCLGLDEIKSINFSKVCTAFDQYFHLKFRQLI